MALFDKWFGKGRLSAQAKAAELRGDLQKAAELYGEALQPDEAARVMMLRGDADTDPRARLQYYLQAAQLASQENEVKKVARLKRAELLLVLAGDATVSAVARHEVLEAARDLEAIGESLKAAEAYARAGDKEGEARALQAAGDVERLEFLLATEQHEERVTRARDERSKDVDLMIGEGKRREALAALDELLAASPDAAPLRARANGLRSRKVSAPIVVVEIAGDRWTFVLGDEIVVGRSEGAINVSSNAVSRQHLRVAREQGAVVVRDLATRNGTQMRGINLAGPLAVREEGLELKLGREVPLRIVPSTRLPGAVEIDVAGERYVACVGPTRLPLRGFELVAGSDGWVELVSREGHVYMGEVEMAPRVTLLAGDAFSTARGAEPVLRVLAS
jgi:tetratricopeptide (TPR) repeat protein